MTALLAVLAVASTAFRPSAPWSISSNNGMVWNGQNYSPVGLTLDPDPAQIAEAQKAGVSNFCINAALGLPWQPFVKQLEDGHSNYLLKISSAAVPALGYDIDPEGYRLANIKNDRHIHISLPGTESVLLLFATMRDGEIESHTVVKTPGGVLDYDLHPQNDLNHILLIYPLQQTMQLPDLWSGADQDRDRLLSQIYSLKSVRGLRGIIDPLGYMPAAIPPEGHVIPTSPIFQAEFAEFLKQKYNNLNFVAQAWGLMMSDQSSYMDFARLIPLWNGSSGAHSLYDPKTDALISVQPDHSSFWDDFHAAITQMAVNRFRNIQNTIRSVVNIPVLQTWNGWSVPYEGSTQVDGVSCAVTGTNFQGTDSDLIGAASSLSRFEKDGWLIISDFQPSTKKLADVMQAIGQFQALNVQGLFLDPANPDEQKLYEGWVSKLALGPASKISALFFPDAAKNPAFAQQLAGGAWWLPAPIAGGRMSLGANLLGYKMVDNVGPAEVIWGQSPVEKEFLLYGDPSKVTVTSYGVENPDPKLKKEGVELNIGTLPLVIRGTAETPAPTTSLAEMADEFAKFKKSPQYNHANIESPEFAYSEALTSLKRTPGPAYAKMLDALYSLQSALGSWYWIPCTYANDPQYGKIVPDLSACKGTVFEVKSNLDQPIGPFELDYNIPRLISVPVHVWAAISGTPDDIKKVTMSYGRIENHAQNLGIAPYGFGYRWYDFGPISMAQNLPKLTFYIDNAHPVSLKFDSILIAPEGTYPSGPQWTVKQTGVASN